MAATQKTLTPTNEVISIPAFADKPDYRLPIDSTEKLADAVNALDSKIENQFHNTKINNGVILPQASLSFTATRAVIVLYGAPDQFGIFGCRNQTIVQLINSGDKIGINASGENYTFTNIRTDVNLRYFLFTDS